MLFSKKVVNTSISPFRICYIPPLVADPHRKHNASYSIWFFVRGVQIPLGIQKSNFAVIYVRCNFQISFFLSGKSYINYNKLALRLQKMGYVLLFITKVDSSPCSSCAWSNNIFPVFFLGIFSWLIEKGNMVSRGKKQDCEQTSPLQTFCFDC